MRSHRLLAALLAASSLPVYSDVGRLPDQFRVEPSGTASYSVPLTLPPGPGLVPSLSFNYNSANRAEGAMGVGWSFSEPPAIVRCGQNKRLDGKITGVQLTSEDRFCGPGGRLILASGASTDYGKAKSTYHPELDPATRYEAKGSVTAGYTVNASLTLPANGPACFIATTKDGRELHYVAEELTDSVCTDGRVAPITTRIWRLTKEYSPVAKADTTATGGDPREAAAIRYQYADVDSDAGRYSPHLSKVFYGNNTIELSYQAKASNYWRFGYFAGRKSHESMLLQTVTVKQGTKTARTYGVSYEKSPDTEHQRVIKISRSDDRGGVMQLTGEVNLGWSNLQRVNAVKGMTFKGVFAQYKNQPGGAQLMDKDGDGIAEIVVRQLDANGTAISDWYEFDGTDRCVPITPTCAQDWDARYAAPMPVFVKSGGSTREYYGVTQADVNADGYTDMVVLHYGGANANFPSTKQVWLNDGSGNYSLDLTLLSSLPDQWLWATNVGGDRGGRLADLNGDGRVDIVSGVSYQYGAEGFCQYFGKEGGFSGTCFSWQNYFFTSVVAGASDVVRNPDLGIRLEDVNGDGMLDLIQAYNYRGWGPYWSSQRRVSLGDGQNFNLSTSYSASEFGNAWFTSGKGVDEGARLVDVNGDGLLDLLTLKYNGGTSYYREALLNTGFTFVSDPDFAASLPDTYLAGPNGVDMGTRPVDFNGDGLVDLVQLYHAPGTGWYGDAPQRRVFLNVGGKFVYRSDLSGLLTDTYFSGGSDGVDMGTRVADVNNDGLPELIQAYDASGSGWYGNAVVRRWHQLFSGKADNLVKITDGLGAETVVNYKASTSGIYKKGSGAAFPLIDVVPPGELVSSVETTNGVGGRNVVGYRYGGARVSREYGALGNEWQEVASSLMGTVGRTEFSQNFPYIGMVKRGQNQYCTTVQLSPWTTSGCSVLKQVDNAFNKQEVTTTPGGKLFQPYVENSVEKAWEMQGL